MGNFQKHKNHDTYFVPGLFRGLRVLEILAEHEAPMSASELAREMEISRSSAFRLVYTLNYMGFTQNAKGSQDVELGGRVLNLGFSFLASQKMIQTARADLKSLRDDTKISSHMAILESKEVLFLECIQSKSGHLSNVNVGRRMPAYQSPLGWILLSDLTSRKLMALYKDVEMTQLTDKTPNTPNMLVDAVNKAVETGIVVSYGSAGKDGISISAPIFDKEGAIVAAIDISGPNAAFDMQIIQSFYIPNVEKAARSISSRLGYNANS